MEFTGFLIILGIVAGIVVSLLILILSIWFLSTGIDYFKKGEQYFRMRLNAEREDDEDEYPGPAAVYTPGAESEPRPVMPWATAQRPDEPATTPDPEGPDGP